GQHHLLRHVERERSNDAPGEVVQLPAPLVRDHNHLLGSYSASSARRTSTCARCARYSLPALASLGGMVSSAACAAASAGVAPPANASSTLCARSGVGPI